MKTITKEKANKYWQALDLLYPKHRMVGQWHEMWKDAPKGYCTDNGPNGWGAYGCKRCQAIVDCGIKIWPRSKNM